MDSPRDLSERELLIEINRQLAHVRELLGDEIGESQDSGYRCHICRDVVAEDERQSHLETEHNAPPAITIEGQFLEL